MIRLAIALAALLLAGSALAAPPAMVSLYGFEGVVPGMRVAQVEARLGVELRLERIGPGSPCGTARLHRGQLRGYALFIGPRLGSLWFERDVRTDEGIRIGSTLAALRRAYPQSRSRPDRYVEDGLNVFVRRTETPHWRLRFDVSPTGKVTMIAFGNDTVFLVEGCA